MKSILRIDMTDKEPFYFKTTTKVCNPSPVGYWLIGKCEYSYLKFSIFKKPNLFHRYMTTLLLGWKWEDYK